MLVSVVAVAAVGLVASLVMAFGPDSAEDAGKVGAARDSAATAVAGADTDADAEEGDSPKEEKEKKGEKGKAKKPSPSPSASPTSAATSPEGASEPAERKRPKATTAPQAASGTAPLAGRIQPGVSYDGVATLYDAGDGNGSCSFGPSEDLMIAAMNTKDYETSKACGATVLVRSGDASVTVRITNECPAPCEPGQLDLSAQAFAELADTSRGRIPITWSLLSLARPETLSIRYKTGSSQYWCGIQAIGHRNPLARLEVRADGAWRQLARTEYNYFLSEQGTGCGGAIRLTDIYGEQLTVDGIAVRPDAVQPTKVQFAKH
ncbi:expansin EXLX1 family cellulose-binding protein [Streptomyces sp. NPDC002643]